MQRYITIDNASGYVWADVVADSIIEAAHASDREVGGESHEYATAGRPNFSNETGYHVYAAPEDFPAVEDGQDAASIDRVMALPLAGYVRRAAADE